jgi:hypothetical protein
VYPESILDSYALPEGSCPKCIGPRRSQATACPSCGLVFGKVSLSRLEPTPAVRELWAALLPRWEDPRAHRCFVQAAAAMGELAMAGRLYRIHLAKEPEDARAKEGLEQIVRLALLPWERPQPGPGKTDARAPRRTLRRGLTLLGGAVGSLFAVRLIIGFALQ